MVIIISVLLSVVASVITSYVVLQWHLRIWDSYIREITENAKDVTEKADELMKKVKRGEIK